MADNLGDILDCVKSVLSEKGILFIIDTDFTIQPYILNVVEHSSFFNKISLQNVLLRKGFEEFSTDFEHESKEIWSFSRVNGHIQQRGQNFYKVNKEVYEKTLDYLNDVVSIVEKVCLSNDKLAIWGMSNGGIWIAEIIKKLGGADRQIIWIEEDEDVLQKEYGMYGYQICRIDSVASGTAVFLPFPSYVAQNIMKRYLGYREKLKFIFFG